MSIWWSATYEQWCPSDEGRAGERDGTERGVPVSRLDEAQHEAVTVVLQAAVRHAATVLNETIDDNVFLSAPPPELCLRHQAVERLDAVAGHQPSIAVRQHFRGRFSGDVLLVFPEASSIELVRAILAEALPLDIMTELEQDALVEVGNVILNACLARIALQLGERLHGGLPQSVRGSGQRIFDSRGVEEDGRRDDLLLFQRIDFAIGARRFVGFLAIAMDSLSAETFRRALDSHIPRKVPA